MSVESENDRLVSLLEELVVWTKFAARSALISAWNSILADDRHLLAYELSDGSRTQLQVAQASGLSQPTISALWARWRRVGIARLQGKTVVHLARPSDFGFERAMKLSHPNEIVRVNSADAEPRVGSETPALVTGG